MSSSEATLFPKRCDRKPVAIVQSRPVATPLNSRSMSGRFSSDSCLPTAAVIATPGARTTPTLVASRHPPVLAHSFSAQSLPGRTTMTAQPTAMCRSRSFTGEVVHSTPRMTACRHTPRNSNVGSWVPPAIPAGPAPVCCVPSAVQSAMCLGVATSFAPPLLSFVPPPPVSFAPPSFVPPPVSSRSVQPQISFVPPPAVVANSSSYVPPAHDVDCDPETYHKNTEVVIGGHRFRCTGVLGRGSFSEVWAGEELGTQDRLEVALKDIQCRAEADLHQGLFEVSLLQGFAAASQCSYSKGAAPPQLRIPRYLAHRMDALKDGKGGKRIRMAMTRVPGEPLDSFLKQPPPEGQDVQSAVRRGCMLAMALIKQLGPTLDIVSQKAIHRDVNAHNVLLSDAVEGGPFRCNVEPEEVAARARFWLIDFGLAVDSTTWFTEWRNSDIGGDCRYWPQSSWFVSFWGADQLEAKTELCNQYLNRLDIFGLGITALELLCTTALDGSNAAGCCQNGPTDGLRGSWRRLLNAWTKYWTDVTRWHTMIYRVFSMGGDVGPLYQELAKEQVVEKILNRMAQIRQCLRDCVRRTEDVRIQNLLNVLSHMLDESSSFRLRDAVESLGGQCSNPAMQQPSNVSSLPSKFTAVALSTDARAQGVIALAPAKLVHGAGSFPRTNDARVHAFRGQHQQTHNSNNNSFVPPHMTSNSFVPPVVAQSGDAAHIPMSTNTSYVPPAQSRQGNDSYAPSSRNLDVVMPKTGLPAQKVMVAQGAPAFSFRPQFGGA